MEFTKNVDATATSGQGIIHSVTRAEIEAAFGAPTYEASTEDTDKVTTEWCIGFADGTVATIYDWKRYELGRPELHERIDWNVGGKNPRAVQLVIETLNLGARIHY